MKTKCLVLVIALLLVGNTWAMACCILNKDVHNGSGQPAWDLKILLEGRVNVQWHYDGYPDSWNFAQFNTWQFQAGGKWYTVLKWFDPRDNGNPDPTPIPHCDSVHVGYDLDGPAKIVHCWWTDGLQEPLPLGHVQQPSHWILQGSTPGTVVLRLQNDAVGVPGDPLYPPCPDPTIVSNVYYAVVDEEIPLDQLNARNTQLESLLQPLPGGAGPDTLLGFGARVEYEIPEPVVDGQYVVYRVQGSGWNGFVDFGEHEMGRGRVPTLTHWGVILLVVLLLTSGVAILLRRKREVTAR